MDVFNANHHFNPYRTEINHCNGNFLSDQPYSVEKKVEIAAMIEQNGLLASSASRTILMEKIAAEGKVSPCFVAKICNKLAIARHQSQQLGRGTQRLRETDEHCLVGLYKRHPFRDVQSYVDNLYLLTGTMAQYSTICNFFKPLRVCVPSFPSSGGSVNVHTAGQDENFDCQTMQQDLQPGPPKVVTPISHRHKMPEHSMITSFHRCGISSSVSNNSNKRNLPSSSVHQEEGESGRPHSRQRLEPRGQSKASCLYPDNRAVLEPVGKATFLSSNTSLVVYQSPSSTSFFPSSSFHHRRPTVVYPVDSMAPPPQAWVPRPPPAVYHDPQKASIICPIARDCVNYC